MQPNEEVRANARATAHDSPRGAVVRTLGVIGEEFSNVTIRYLVARWLTFLITNQVGNRLRTWIWRCLGWRVSSEALILGDLKLSGRGAIRRRLSVGRGVWINEGCRIELNDVVSIEDNSAIGHDVLILTSTHRLGSLTQRASDLVTGPVVIGSGSWIGARCVIFPGVHVGSGAVVSAGSIVNKDVPPNTVVSGVPATVVVQRIPG